MSSARILHPPEIDPVAVPPGKKKLPHAAGIGQARRALFGPDVEVNPAGDKWCGFDQRKDSPVRKPEGRTQAGAETEDLGPPKVTVQAEKPSHGRTPDTVSLPFFPRSRLC